MEDNRFVTVPCGFVDGLDVRENLEVPGSKLSYRGIISLGGGRSDCDELFASISNSEDDICVGEQGSGFLQQVQIADVGNGGSASTRCDNRLLTADISCIHTTSSIHCLTVPIQSLSPVPL
jgi:hypothetical protein